MAQVPNPNDYPSRHLTQHNPEDDAVIVSEPSIARKFWNVFQLKDLSEIREYIFEDIIVPGFKRAVRGVVDIILDGEVRSSNNSRSSTGYINYNKIKNMDREDHSEKRKNRRGNRDFRLIEFTSEAIAKAVYDDMMDEFRRYGRVPIASFYESVEKQTNHAITITPYFTDFSYGWNDLNGLRIKGRVGHYVLDFPRAEPLD